jgi:choline dehydrogenase
VLPYFRRAEGREEGGDSYRGSDGPLKTSYGTLRNPLYGAFIEAAREAGYPTTPDVNGFRQEGFGRMDMTVYKGRRWSAANAYLKPAARRPNLSIQTRALATRVLFEDRRAAGVEYLRGGETKRVMARREVILSAGPINDPQLLKLSGIGHGEELAALGIQTVHHLPGVGENLQDHLEFYFQMAASRPITLYSSLNPLAKAMIGARWLLTKDGLGATNHFESCGFIRSRPGVPYPDVQYHFLPVAVRYDGHSMASEHGFQAHVGPMRSKSRGYVRLKSKDARDAPLIRFNYLDHPDDWIEMRACVRLTREIFAQKAFEPYRGREIQPGDDVVTDAAIDEFVARHVESAYHPCGTCRMGDPRNPMTVVDPETRVVGVDGLRIADSSIMPTITNGNLNAPTIMIGEKASDHILGKSLPPSNAPFYRAPDWETAQR